MTTKKTIDDHNDDTSLKIPDELKCYAPDALLAKLYDELESNKNYVFEITQIYILSTILNEQIRRHIIKPGTKKKYTGGMLILH